MSVNKVSSLIRPDFDFFPTPPGATEVVRVWLEKDGAFESKAFGWLDPAAGDGDLIEAMRGPIGASSAEQHWTAIEIDKRHQEKLELVAEEVRIEDALGASWPEASVVANPPFNLLDRFWLKAAEHRKKYPRWIAMFTPVAWWNAEKRRDYTRPDTILALGWRPVFRHQEGPGHKGSQDFCWSILTPDARSVTTWERVEKPTELRSNGRRTNDRQSNMPLFGGMK